MKICGSLGLFILMNVLAHSTGKTLLFEVLSVLPTSPDGAPIHLSGTTPLTVVFSLPVIRLGTL